MNLPFTYVKDIISKEDLKGNGRATEGQTRGTEPVLCSLGDGQLCAHKEAAALFSSFV